MVYEAFKLQRLPKSVLLASQLRKYLQEQRVLLYTNFAGARVPPGLTDSFGVAESVRPIPRCEGGGAYV